MTSVTYRIKEIKQPWGGYVKPNSFTEIELDNLQELNPKENISPALVGLVVDYLSRFKNGTSRLKSFEPSIKGALASEYDFGQEGNILTAQKLINGIKGLDNFSIINACKLVTFDAWFRNPYTARNYKTASETNPDMATIENIRIMVERSLRFWETYGGIVQDGFTFEHKGYTKTVSSGDGDFLTSDTLFDMKVIKGNITSSHTLQLAMYYLMGKRSGKTMFDNIENIGIFNPRRNRVFTLEVSKIPQEILEAIERDVICYEDM